MDLGSVLAENVLNLLAFFNDFSCFFSFPFFSCKYLLFFIFLFFLVFPILLLLSSSLPSLSSCLLHSSAVLNFSLISLVSSSSSYSTLSLCQSLSSSSSILCLPLGGERCGAAADGREERGKPWEGRLCAPCTSSPGPPRWRRSVLARRRPARAQQPEVKEGRRWRGRRRPTIPTIPTIPPTGNT